MTGGSVCISQPIKVTFNSPSGLTRWPISHTCSSTLELSTSYVTYMDFSTESSRHFAGNVTCKSPEPCLTGSDISHLPTLAVIVTHTLLKVHDHFDYVWKEKRYKHQLITYRSIAREWAPLWLQMKIKRTHLSWWPHCACLLGCAVYEQLLPHLESQLPDKGRPRHCTVQGTFG